MGSLCHIEWGKICYEEEVIDREGRVEVGHSCGGRSYSGGRWRGAA